MTALSGVLLLVCLLGFLLGSMPLAVYAGLVALLLLSPGAFVVVVVLGVAAYFFNKHS